MSRALYWEPLHRDKRSLADALKFAMRKRFGDPVNVTLDANEVAYLQGLLHAGMDEAQKLIDAIEAHGEISVTEGG